MMQPNKYNRNRTMPGIPEIVQAYQNDPRTKAALDLMNPSTAPVAQGGWGWAEGIARALGGVAGGFIEKSQRGRYDRDEADLIEARKSDVPSRIAAMLAGEGGEDGTSASDINVNPAAVSQASMFRPQAPAAPLGGGLAGVTQNAPSALDGPQAPPAAPASFLPPIAPSMPALVPSARRMPPAAPANRQGVAPFIDPLAGRGRATSTYGRRKAPIAGASTFHNGIDLAAEAGTPVQAAGEGVVVQAWFDSKNGGGNSVIVRHPDGTKTGYAHLSEIGVKNGDPVSGGQVIGKVGSTGRATGPHLHFTARDASGKRINPTTLKMGIAVPGEAPQANISGEEAPDIYGNAPVELPDMPDPLARPELPQAEGPVQSERTMQAYRMLLRGNKYEAAAAQAMLDKGLGEQNSNNESAAERRQRLVEKGYESDESAYRDDRSTRLTGAVNARNTFNNNQQQYQNQRGLNQQNFGHDMQKEDRRFVHEMKRAGFDRETSYGLANLNNDAAFRRVNAEIDARRGTAEERLAAKRDAVLTTVFGRERVKTLEANAGVAAHLDNFEALNKEYETGGFANNYAPGVLTPNNAKMQEMETIANKLVADGAGALKGSTSDKDVAFLLKSVPSVKNLRSANTAIIRNWRYAMQRSNEYNEALLNIASAPAAERTAFFRDYGRFRDTVSITTGVTFEQYKNRVRIDANGNRIP